METYEKQISLPSCLGKLIEVEIMQIPRSEENSKTWHPWNTLKQKLDNCGGYLSTPRNLYTREGLSSDEMAYAWLDMLAKIRVNETCRFIARRFTKSAMCFYWKKFLIFSHHCLSLRV